MERCVELERESEGLKERLHGLQEHAADPGKANTPLMIHCSSNNGLYCARMSAMQVHLHCLAEHHSTCALREDGTWTGAVNKDIQQMRSLRLAMASPLDTARSARVSASPGARTGAAEQLDLLKAAHARVATLEAAVRQQGARLEQAQAALSQAEVAHAPYCRLAEPAMPLANILLSALQ